MRKRTKIICTIGPASRDETIIRHMIQTGMNVARFNFSHMTRDEAFEAIDIIHRIRKDLDCALPIMLDTKGPEVRLYGYTEEQVLEKGDTITIESYEGPDITSVTPRGANHYYTNLPTVTALSRAGSRILLMDGFIEGEVVNITDTQLEIRLKNRGVLRPRAHFAIPKVDYPLPFLSEQDRKDIAFALDNHFEYIALSFVGSGKDVQKVRELMSSHAPESRTQLIAKIENRSAVEHLQEIIEQSDGIMVARGDLGVELDMAEVPVIQKKIIQMCYRMGKPVITATQMLESMVEKRIPTRAEASDVANACFDLTSAVMLSGETAVGQHPVQVVAMMSSIIDNVEEELRIIGRSRAGSLDASGEDLTSIINSSAVSIAEQSDADAIAVVTKTGYSARMLSRVRPMVPMWAFTYDPVTYQQLELNWGVNPVLIDEATDFESMVEVIKGYCVTTGIAERGGHVVIVGGLPLGRSGTTNMVRMETL